MLFTPEFRDTARFSVEPWLKAQGMPNGTHEFKAQAWHAANNKARELGWIV
jgi:hypothetical protein